MMQLREGKGGTAASYLCVGCARAEKEGRGRTKPILLRKTKHSSTAAATQSPRGRLETAFRTK